VKNFAIRWNPNISMLERQMYYNGRWVRIEQAKRDLLRDFFSNITWNTL
jgi:hypothetical protein